MQGPFKLLFLGFFLLLLSYVIFVFARALRRNREFLAGLPHFFAKRNASFKKKTGQVDIKFINDIYPKTIGMGHSFEWLATQQTASVAICEIISQVRGANKPVSIYWSYFKVTGQERVANLTIVKKDSIITSLEGIFPPTLFPQIKKLHQQTEVVFDKKNLGSEGGVSLSYEAKDRPLAEALMAGAFLDELRQAHVLTFKIGSNGTIQVVQEVQNRGYATQGVQRNDFNALDAFIRRSENLVSSFTKISASDLLDYQ